MQSNASKQKVVSPSNTEAGKQSVTVANTQKVIKVYQGNNLHILKRANFKISPFAKPKESTSKQNIKEVIKTNDSQELSA